MQRPRLPPVATMATVVAGKPENNTRSKKNVTRSKGNSLLTKAAEVEVRVGVFSPVNSPLTGGDGGSSSGSGETHTQQLVRESRDRQWWFSSGRNIGAREMLAGGSWSHKEHARDGGGGWSRYNEHRRRMRREVGRNGAARRRSLGRVSPRRRPQIFICYVFMI